MEHNNLVVSVHGNGSFGLSIVVSDQSLVGDKFSSVEIVNLDGGVGNRLVSVVVSDVDGHVDVCALRLLQRGNNGDVQAGAAVLVVAHRVHRLIKAKVRLLLDEDRVLGHGSHLEGDLSVAVGEGVLHSKVCFIVILVGDGDAGTNHGLQGVLVNDLHLGGDVRAGGDRDGLQLNNRHRVAVTTVVNILTGDVDLNSVREVILGRHYHGVGPSLSDLLLKLSIQ